MSASRRAGWGLLLASAALSGATAHAQAPEASDTLAPSSAAVATPEEPAPPQPTFRPKARVMTGFDVEREHPSSEQGGEHSTDYGFFLRQARIGLEAELDIVSLDVSAELSDAIRPPTSSSIDRPPYLRNGYLDVRLHKAFRVRAGRYKRPFSRIELESSGTLPFRGRGLANRVITRDGEWGARAIGLMFWGKAPGKLRWHASFTKPGWAPDGDLEADGLDAIARLEWRASRGLELGLSGGHKLEVRTGTPQRNANAVGLDAQLEAGAFTLVLDAMLAQLTDVPSAVTGDPDTLPLAYALTSYATYDIPLGGGWRLQPIAFAEYAEADSEYARTEAVRVIGGVNLWLGEHFRVMPQVEIVRPTATASELSPWSSSESYYVMFVARM